MEKVPDMRRKQSKTSLEMVAQFKAKHPVESPPAERISPAESPPSDRPSKRPAESPPLMDFLVNEIDATSHILTPPLITRCDESTQTNPQPLISNP
ncbi:hypothetical protein TNCV_409791 [Trichonephila clavipes]|nr:hypothetical protein TNCV_409791 [Trichonephila clavipes]